MTPTYAACDGQELENLSVKQNKAEVDMENLSYQFVKKQVTQDTMERDDCGQQTILMVHNPYGLKIRSEKQIAEVLNLSRSQVQRMIQEGEMEKISSQTISLCIRGSAFMDQES